MQVTRDGIIVSDADERYQRGMGSDEERRERMRAGERERERRSSAKLQTIKTTIYMLFTLYSSALCSLVMQLLTRSNKRDWFLDANK